jgi:hypothetical protein
MKKQKMELNKKLFLNKKSIATLNSSEMNQIQGGLPGATLPKYGCAPSDGRCGGTNGGGGTCESLGFCHTGLAQQCF